VITALVPAAPKKNISGIDRTIKVQSCGLFLHHRGAKLLLCGKSGGDFKLAAILLVTIQALQRDL
jgi:hypothetical protein